ncbi:MgtC/SapB family protein [Aromatoleum toluclasticum]|uniref:MgtC/SapB family protein n=1 Tax=Aromatoleum toluclasticum TaxID=92003 RepID=UPI001D1853B5|nr:MgtC/SapB family protein [Aromatoleum toluclasticum]MCC4116025.1 MgtC/SapB family protein [Aromatoleum toluclasticum]
MPFAKPVDFSQIEAFLIAIGIGLLIGFERERVASARAGVRTFGLVGLFGALAGMLGEHLASIAPIVVGMAIMGAMIIAAYLRHPDPVDPGTTSVAALLVCYCLGVAVWLGHAMIAVILSVATTILLYFKTELRGVATRLEAKEWISIFQFAVLSLVVLPFLPNETFDPYHAINPRQVWWMVVLISGLSLAGYATLRLVGARYGAAFVGIAGGLASSTATTLVYARNARETPPSAPMAALVIVLANLVMMIRVAVIAAVVAPGIVKSLALAIAPALLLGSISLFWYWREQSNGQAFMPETRNPTELRTALGFGAVYAVVLFISAWLSDIAGRQGMYVLALVSGLTDMDAIALSSMRLFNLGKLALDVAVIAIGLAMIANLVFKTGIAVVVGGRPLGMKILGGMGAVAAGLGGGIAWLAMFPGSL